MKRTSLKNLRLLACLGVSIACLAAGRAWGDGVKYVSDGSAFTEGTAPAGAGTTYRFEQAQSGSDFKSASGSAAPGGAQPSGKDLGKGPSSQENDDIRPGAEGGPPADSPEETGSNSDGQGNSTKSPDSTTPESPASDTSTPDFGSSDLGLTTCPPGQCRKPPRNNPPSGNTCGSSEPCCAKPVENRPDYCHMVLLDCQCQP